MLPTTTGGEGRGLLGMRRNVNWRSQANWRRGEEDKENPEYTYARIPRGNIKTPTTMPSSNPTYRCPSGALAHYLFYSELEYRSDEEEGKLGYRMAVDENGTGDSMVPQRTESESRAQQVQPVEVVSQTMLPCPAGSLVHYQAARELSELVVTDSSTVPVLDWTTHRIAMNDDVEKIAGIELGTSPTHVGSSSQITTDRQKGSQVRARSITGLHTSPIITMRKRLFTVHAIDITGNKDSTVAENDVTPASIAARDPVMLSSAPAIVSEQELPETKGASAFTTASTFKEDPTADMDDRPAPAKKAKLLVATCSVRIGTGNASRIEHFEADREFHSMADSSTSGPRHMAGAPSFHSTGSAVLGKASQMPSDTRRTTSTTPGGTIASLSAALSASPPPIETLVHPLLFDPASISQFSHEDTPTRFSGSRHSTHWRPKGMWSGPTPKGPEGHLTSDEQYLKLGSPDCLRGSPHWDSADRGFGLEVHLNGVGTPNGTQMIGTLYTVNLLPNAVCSLALSTLVHGVEVGVGLRSVGVIRGLPGRFAWQARQTASCWSAVGISYEWKHNSIVMDLSPAAGPQCSSFLLAEVTRAVIASVESALVALTARDRFATLGMHPCPQQSLLISTPTSPSFMPVFKALAQLGDTSAGLGYACLHFIRCFELIGTLEASGDTVAAQAISDGYVKDVEKSESNRRMMELWFEHGFGIATRLASPQRLALPASALRMQILPPYSNHTTTKHISDRFEVLLGALANGPGLALSNIEDTDYLAVEMALREMEPGTFSAATGLNPSVLAQLLSIETPQDVARRLAVQTALGLDRRSLSEHEICVLRLGLLDQTPKSASLQLDFARDKLSNVGYRLIKDLSTRWARDQRYSDGQRINDATTTHNHVHDLLKLTQLTGQSRSCGLHVALGRPSATDNRGWLS